MKQKTKKTVLLDGDILVYQAATVCEEPVDWGEGLWTLHAHEQDALASFISQYANVWEGTNADDVKLFITGPTNYRKDVLPDYKGNRTDKRKPLLLKWLRQHLLENYDAIMLENIEADDAIGLYSDIPNCVIVSKDKDLLTISGTHWDKDKGFFEVTQEEADYNLHMQILTGDATDNYKGCTGVGPVKAAKILAQDMDPWDAIVGAFKKAGFGETEAIVQARCARILRPHEYNFDTNEAQLWTPKTTSTNQTTTPAAA